MNLPTIVRKASALLAILGLWLLGAATPGLAAHLTGADLSAAINANGSVAIQYTTFYDCSGPMPGDSIQVYLKAQGCQADTTFYLRLNGMGLAVNPYCATVGNACNTTSANNIIRVSYGITRTLSAAHLQCQKWKISVKECGRFPAANLPQAANGCLYSEAYINRLGGNVAVNTPVFNYLPNLFVTTYSIASISNLATPQLAADSLVYTLKPALADSNNAFTYTSGTSFQNPIPSSSGFSLHPRTGILNFTPNMFMPLTTPGANTYAVVMEVAAYRKVNGVQVKVSASQRTLPVVLVDNNPNENPEIINASVNGQLIQPNTIIEVPTNAIFRLEFNTQDPNPSDNLDIQVPEFLQAGYNFTLQTGTWPSGTITGKGAATPDSLVRYYPITVKDNNCPVRGTVTHIYGIKTVPRLTGIKKEQVSEGYFQAVPNPFQEQVTFNFASENKPQAILIYNLLGQEIDRILLKNAETKTVWFNAEKHPAGLYVAKLVKADKTVQTLKFTKLR